MNPLHKSYGMTDDDTKAIKGELSKLFTLVGTLAVGTGLGLIGHGSGQLGIKALKRCNLGNYNELNLEEKEIAEEIVQFASRLAVHYFKHHKEASEKRRQASRDTFASRGKIGNNQNDLRQQMAELDRMLESHATEILKAAIGASQHESGSRNPHNAFVRAAASCWWQVCACGIRNINADNCEVTGFQFKDVRATAEAGRRFAVFVRVRAKSSYDFHIWMDLTNNRIFAERSINARTKYQHVAGVALGMVCLIVAHRGLNQTKTNSFASQTHWRCNSPF